MADATRYLIIRLSSIGDCLHCTPVARELKLAQPDSHITWLVGKVPAGLLQENPYIDTVHVWPREEWEGHLRARRFRQAWRLWKNLTSWLQNEKFDIVLDVHGLFITGMIAMASGAKRRIGLSGTKELNSWFMTEQAPAVSSRLHVIYRYLSILRPLGIRSADHRMTLIVPAEAAQFAETFLRNSEVRPGDPVVAVNLATSWITKNWPAHYFAAVTRLLARRCKVILCGSLGERALADRIIRQSGVPLIDMVGRTTLTELAAVLARCDALITGDTGPLHMAVALETPTVSIFGPTNPNKFGPLPEGHIVLEGEAGCRPCHKQKCHHATQLQCMYSVPPARVLKAVGRLIGHRLEDMSQELSKALSKRT